MPHAQKQLVDEPGIGPARPRRALPGWASGLLAAVALFLFISSVNMIGAGLKVAAKDEAGDQFLKWLFSLVEDPVTGLFVGLLVTSLVQSSSFTTSMTVGLAAKGLIPLEAAIPIIMGANVGTSVTNILVSLAHVRRRLEFRRSLGGAIVHDFFNVLSVLLFLPLEILFGIISRPTLWVSQKLGGTVYFDTNPAEHVGFIKQAFGALSDAAKWLTLDVIGLSPTVGGIVLAVAALVLLFSALWLLVKMLRGFFHERLTGMFSKTLFRDPVTAFVVGIVLTSMVQSSSVTTSLVVPLVGAGVLKLRQIYPYTLGANIGTTVTAMLAALGTASADGMACAFGHLLFNLLGTAVFWPLQFIPISLAKGFAKMASRRRLVAAAYIIGVFFLLPIVVMLVIHRAKFFQ